MNQKMREMITSSDEEMRNLGGTLFRDMVEGEIEKMEKIADYFDINHTINLIPPNIFASGKLGAAFRQSSSLRKELKIKAQKKWLEIKMKQDEPKERFMGGDRGSVGNE